MLPRPLPPHPWRSGRAGLAEGKLNLNPTAVIDARKQGLESFQFFKLNRYGKEKSAHG